MFVLKQYIIKYKPKNIVIDKAYAVIATKLELCIIFGIVYPYIVFIASLAIISNYHFYRIVILKLKWKIHVKGSNKNENQFPTFSLLGSIFMAQILILLYCYDLINSVIHWVIIGVILVADTIFIAACVKLHKQVSQTNYEAM